ARAQLSTRQLALQRCLTVIAGAPIGGKDLANELPRLGPCLLAAIAKGLRDAGGLIALVIAGRYALARNVDQTRCRSVPIARYLLPFAGANAQPRVPRDLQKSIR